MNTSEIEALFAETLAGEYDGKDAWLAVEALRRDGSRAIFEHAAGWCLSDDHLRRARAVAILCQLRCATGTNRGGERSERLDPERTFRDESFSLVIKMLENEQDPMVLDSAICALGHLDIARAVPAILRYQDHPNESVRFVVAFARGRFPNDPRSVHGLLKLASDVDAEVRDWAVFGIGVQGMPTVPRFAMRFFGVWTTRMEVFAKKLPLAWEDVKTNGSSRSSV